jgi:acyl-CoA hydrolase
MPPDRALARKRRTAEEAAALLRPTDTMAIGLGPCQPASFLRALGERDDWERLTIFGALLTGLYKVFTRRGVTLLSGFYGPVERGLREAGFDVRFVPADFRRFGRLARSMRPRVMATLVAPPDAQGRCSLALHAGATVAELHRAGRDPERLLVAEVNPKLPRTLGLPPDHPHALSLDEIDVIVESDADPFYLPDAASDAVEQAIAGFAASFIPDGATLQTGIGGIPSEIAARLAEGPGGDYGVHSEMFTTGLMQLHRAGKVTNRKGIYDGFSACTFAAGTAELYAWLDGCEQVRFLPVEAINDPAIIARNRSMVSINGALSIDLAGQIAADALNGRQYSGIGGHEDFVSGSALAEGGRSLVCLPSVALLRGEAGEPTRVSRIAAAFPAGALVTTPRHQVDVVITEWGAAELAGCTVEDRAAALVAIAHPDFRDALRAEAEQRGYFRAGGRVS